MDLLGLAIKQAIFPTWVRKNRSARLRYLAEIETSQNWSREQLADHQWNAFRRVVTTAFESSPYYREKFRAAGLSLQDLRSPEDIRHVPPIAKEEIQEHGGEMICTGHSKADLIRDMTGGSTGSPMIFHYTKDRHDSREAATLRHDRWTGWDIGTPRAVLWGAPQDMKLRTSFGARARELLIERRMMLDASSLSEAAMHSFAKRLLDYPSSVILAYANTLGLFARFAQAEGIRGLRAKAIIASAEVLTPETRAVAQEVFGCEVYNRYGSREFGVIASECSVHSGMHTNADNLLVEVQPDPAAAQPGTGEILITDLRNFAMPMIRYRIRDMGRLLPEPCRCGRGLPLLELSGGRVTDFLEAVDGSKVSGIVLATYAITNIQGVRQIQFVQQARGTITVNIVKGPAWTDDSRRQLLERVHKFLGATIQIETLFRDVIPLEKSGKYRFAISTLTARAGG
jgi:phenylacetate-coenzyme A ligase PaaK-like adenylate-forming protein